MKAFLALIRRDLQLGFRIGGGGMAGLVFFASCATLIPFALGPDLNLLSRIAPAILWLSALLACLLGLERLFQADEEDGALDVLRLSPLPMEMIVLAKCFAHWLGTVLPLIASAPLIGLLVAMPGEGVVALMATLIAGTPALTFIGAAGAALTVSIRRGGLILAVLVLPFMIPVLVFGVSAANAALGGTVPFATPFLILTALTLLSGVIGIAAAAWMLKMEE